MMTLAILLTLCGDVTVTQSVRIDSTASIERLAAEAAADLLPIAWDRFAGGAGLAGEFRPRIRDAWSDLQLNGFCFRYGYSAAIAGRQIRRSTLVELHHLWTSVTLLSGLPQYCKSATLTLDARERLSGLTRLVLTLSLRLHHPREDKCLGARLARRIMCREGSAEARLKLAGICTAGRAAVRDGRAVLETVAAEFAAGRNERG